MIPRRWRIRLGVEAQRDLDRILKYTRETFGQRHADVYRVTLFKPSRRLSTAQMSLGVLRETKFLQICEPFTWHAKAAAADISSYIGPPPTM